MNGITVMACICSAFAGLMIGVLIEHSKGSEFRETQAIERGYAQYCPTTGRFAWKGECNATLMNGEE